MNFSKKWKRFCTFSRKHEGFTLVELIVVIAIMAILAGVAVPAYTGYINKANKASDLQLLGAINTAFAAACMENDTAATALPDGSVTFDISNMTVNKYRESFERYYAGNTGTFKVIEKLLFVKGVFVDPTGGAEGVTAVQYAGGTLYFTDEQLEAIRNSTFNTDLGINDLMDQVDSVADMAAGFGNGYVNQLMASPEFVKNLVQYLGGDTKAEDINSELMNVADSLIQDELVNQGYNLTDPDADNYLDPNSDDYFDKYAEINDTVVKNALVLYTAQNASGQSTNEIMSIINSSNPKETLTSYMGNTATAGAGFGNAALVYGAFTAYATATKNEAALGAVNNSTDPTAVFDLLAENETERVKFQNYMKNNPQGMKDLEACISAMDMVNNSSSDKNALNDVLLNGYNNQNLVGALEGLLNPSTAE